MKYIAVFHHWWMSSIRFETEEIQANCLEDAETKADAIAHRKNRDFNHCRALVLEIGNDEYFLRRDLTWRERITCLVECRKAPEANHAE